jgi:hypothetical protein
MQRRSIKKITTTTDHIKSRQNVHHRNIVRRDNVVQPREDSSLRIDPRNIPKAVIENAAPPKRDNFNYSFVDKIWDGETVYILGGGPSLENFDFKGLHGSKVIAINKGIYSYPNAQVLYWTDSRFYTWYKKDIDNFCCLKYTIKQGNLYNEDVRVLRKGAVHGLEEPRDTLAHGNNSGYAAINLAYHLGAKRIILLGFDMRNDGTKTHFHDGYPTRGTGDRMYIDKFLPGFKSLASSLKQKGITVLNASTYSRLNVFTKISLDAALSFR